jgi:hypothetical protein
MFYSEKAFTEIDEKLNKTWPGVVVDSNDPEQHSRVKVIVPSLFEGKVEDLIWCYNIASLGGSKVTQSLFIPQKGSQVLITFPFGDLYAPCYSGFIPNKSMLNSEFLENFPDVYGIEDINADFKFIVDRQRNRIEFRQISSNSGFVIL